MFKRLCACAFVVFLYGLPAAAQFADAGSGIQPYQKYDLTQIGAVNLYNGRLTVDVPLFDYKQVGQLPDLKIDLVMNSSSWVLVPYNGSGCNGCEVWAPVGQLDDNGTYSQTSLGKISYHAGGQYTYGFYAGPPYTNGSNPFYSYAQDYSGATHFFGNSESLDGTGLQLTINNGSVDIIDKNGISYKSGCAQENQNYNCIQYQRQIVDPNSNSISWNFNSGNQIPYSITDSVGRSIPLFDLTLASTGCHQVGFPGPQGASASTIQICISNHQVTTSFMPSSGVMQYSGTLTLVDSIQLSSGEQYTFQYDTVGDLTQVGLPTGGSIGFTWNTVFSGSGNDQTAYQEVASRTLTTGTTSGVWTYITGPYQSYTVVRDPNQNDTLHVFDGSGYEYETDYFQGAYSLPSGGGSCTGSPTASNLLKTELTCFTPTTTNTYYGITSVNGIPEIPTQTTTRWQNGQTSTVVDEYDFSQTWEDYNYENEFGSSGAISPYTTGSLLSTSTYDYGSGSAGPLLQKQVLNYKWQSDSNYFNANLLSIPSSVVLQDGSQNRASETDYTYDESVYGPSGVRGNLTATSQYLNTGSALQTHTYFNSAGMPTQIKDAGNFSTGITYQCNGAFPYVLTNAAGFQTTYGYDCNSAQLTSVMDANNQTITYGYDAGWNQNSVGDPDGGSTSLTYTANQVSQFQYQNASTNIDTETLFDGLGRTSRSALSNGQSTNPWYQADVCYNSDGQVSFSSYRYQGSGFGASPVCSGNGDAYLYDALGRVTQVTHGDATSLQYIHQGRATKLIDENGVTRISQVDGLGRTTAVCEISSNSTMPGSGSPSSCGLDIAGTGFLTTYAYDLANHKTTVTQGVQSRVFQSDSVGRQVYALEPESGITTFSYAYNGTGLVVTRQKPKANQPSSSVLTTTTTQYDAISRPLSITYTDGTPTRYFAYDLNNGWGGSYPQNYLKGRLAAAYTQNTATIYGYDPMGRVVLNGECTPATCGTTGFPLYYSYDLAGNLKTATDGFGTTTTYTITRANEISTITSSLNDSKHPPNLVSNIQNGPYGPLSWQLGNGLCGAQQFDSLGRVRGGGVYSGSAPPNCSSGSQLYAFSSGWTGRYLTSSSDSVLGQNSSYTLDEFGRLSALNVNTGNPGSFMYSYDRWGNRVAQTVVSGSGPQPNYSFSNNKIQGGSCSPPTYSQICYDAAGNETSDGTNTYSYDAEGNIIQEGTTAFTYDALNQQVRQNYGSVASEVLFGVNGQLASLTWAGGSQIMGKAYWGGTPIESYLMSANAAYFQHFDWNSNKRLTTDYSGAVYGEEAELPFGDGFRNVTGHRDNTFDDFGGLWDNGSTMHAKYREYSDMEGRWMSPDPYSGSMDFTNPQTLNRYAYVLNNPLNSIDPDGLQCFQVDTDGNFTGASNAGDCSTDANGNPTNNDVYIDDEKATNPFMDSNGDLLGYTNGGGQQVGADGDPFPNAGTLGANGFGTSLNDIDTQIAPSAFEFIQDVNQDNQHQIGCIAQAYGIAVPGNAGAAAVGAPLAPKRFAAWGASQGTSWLSKSLGNAYKGGSFPGKNYASPTGGLFSGGKPFQMGTTANFGKAVGRWAPYAVSAATTAYASYQLWNCLGK